MTEEEAPLRNGRKRVIRDDTENERAQHHAGQAGAEYRPQGRLGHVPFVEQSGRDIGHGLNVKSVNGHA